MYWHIILPRLWVETAQSCSSDKSPQSLSPSQIHRAGMQRPLLAHWNWSALHATRSHRQHNSTFTTLLYK